MDSKMARKFGSKWKSKFGTHADTEIAKTRGAFNPLFFLL
jgi:hypothetical protein